MRRALRLAERGRGRTSPNPIVGAVVVRDGRVVREMRLGEEERDLEVEMRVDRPAGGLTEELARFGREARAAGDRLFLRVDGEDRVPEITRWLAGQGVGLYSLNARRPSLEEIFLEVIGDAPVLG